MTEFAIPPCPDALLHKLKEPCRFQATREYGQERGTVWEVVAPDGEVLLVLIVEQFEEVQAGPFPILRAIPLSDFVRLTDVGDTVVVVEPSAMVVAAHCWLEGPVLPGALKQSIGSVSAADMRAVEKARARDLGDSSDPFVAAFRQSLFEQFDPLFSSSWDKLYAHFDDVVSDGVQERLEHTEANRSEIEANSAPRFQYALDEEYAMAATDESPITGGPTVEERCTIAYLTTHIPEILRHGNSSVWFKLGSDGGLVSHTYDERIADGYVGKSGPHAVPLFIQPEHLIEPDVRKLLEWFSTEIGMRRAAAEKVCLNLGLNW